MITDPYIIKLSDPGKMAEYSVQAIFAIGVIAIETFRDKWKINAAPMKPNSRLTVLRRTEPGKFPKALLGESKNPLPGEKIHPEPTLD